MIDTAALKPRWSKYIPKTNFEGKKYKPTAKQIAFLMLPHMEAMFGGSAGSGKIVGQNDSVLTPFGFKKCPDLRVGDLVNNPDGSVARIIQLKAWETLPKWTVFFNDGSKLEVAEEHLWLAWRSGKKKKRDNEGTFGEESAEVITTRELKEWSDAAREQKKNGVKRPHWPLIPVCKPQKFNVSGKYPIKSDPYLIGVLLGDGCITDNNLRITTSGEDYWNHWQHEIPSTCAKYDGNKTIIPRGKTRRLLIEELTRYKLLGTNSKTKFIPRILKCGSVKTRVAVLQGLMDTDGTVDTQGHLSFTSISEQLTDDVKFLVQSLGGTATKTIKAEPFYTDKYGNKIVCNEAFVLYIKLPKTILPFRMERKLDRFSAGNDSLIHRRVVKVVPKGTITGRCISVSHPNGLYITNDFIVTHNSEVLLISALQYVDIPHYSAIIFRRAITDSQLAGGIYDRAIEWLAPFIATGEVKHDGRTSTFTFPSGATLTIAYLRTELDHFRYASAEFQFIGFDELTQFEEMQYTFLFSRLRRKKGSKIPLRVRSGTNPCGIGVAWVKKRFQIYFNKERQRWEGQHPHRKFIPSFFKDMEDNVDISYLMSLQALDPMTRRQMKDGDWSTEDAARFKQSYFATRWTTSGSYFSLLGQTKAWHKDTCEIFASVDAAASQQSLPGGLSVKRNKGPCWSVIGFWAKTPDNYMLLLDVIRRQCEIPELLELLYRGAIVYKPNRIIVEKNGLGTGVCQIAASRGFPIDEVWSSSDKISNAAYAITRAEQGKLILPDYAPWLDEYEDELFNWMGTPNELDDQVDMTAKAGIYVHGCIGSTERVIYQEVIDMLPATRGGWNNGIVSGY